MAAEIKVTDAVVDLVLASYLIDWDQCNESTRDAHRNIMRAALEAGLAAMLEPVNVVWEPDGSTKGIVWPTADDVQEGVHLTPMGFSMKKTKYWKAHIGCSTGGDYPKHDLYRIRRTKKMTTTPTKNESLPETGSWLAADDVYRHARSIDVALNGEEGAASRPALCDVVAQIASLACKHGPLAAALTREAPTEGVDYDEVYLLLQAAQSNIGAARPDYDEDDANHWDRLTAAMESVKAASLRQPDSIHHPVTPPAPPTWAQGEYNTAWREKVRELWLGVPVEEVEQARDQWFARVATQPPHHDRGELADIADRLRNLSRIMAGGDGTDPIEAPAWKRVEEHADRIAALTEAKQQGPGEAVAVSREDLATVVRIAMEGRAPFHSEARPILRRWSAMLDGAPQVEAKGQTGASPALMAAGWMLSNCAYNLAQCGRLTDAERRSLDESRKAWDAAAAKPSGEDL